MSYQLSEGYLRKQIWMTIDYTGSMQMDCPICKNELARITSSGVWIEFHCPECGIGRITVELLSLMMLQQSRFDVSLSRKWIAERRKFDPLPIMQTSDFPLVITH